MKLLTSNILITIILKIKHYRIYKLSLGAYHDGANSPSGFSQCLASNGNIMTPTAMVTNEYNQYLNIFSKCSINAFKNNLLSLNLR